MVIELEPTKDILASLGLIKQHQFLVGFALETTDEEENAIVKLEKKNLDAIVLIPFVIKEQDLQLRQIKLHSLIVKKKKFRFN